MKPENDYQQFLTKNPYPRQLKSLEPLQGFSSIYFNDQGKKYINFSSSDYLGLANHPKLIEAAQAYAQRYGVGSAASRLVSGNFDCYLELENKVATLTGKPAALIMATGYQTNLSVLEALLDRKVLGHPPLVLCDKYCHASLLAVMRHSTEIHRFQHNNLLHLRQLLERYADMKRHIFILAESIYSMEGDEADLPGLIALAQEYQAFLYIDDAHAVGIYGSAGAGKAARYAENIPLIMGTFSKGLGSFGGFIACSQVIKNYLIHTCRGLIYSTGTSPVILGAMMAAIDLLPHLQVERQRLFHHVERIRASFHQLGLDTGNSTTHIIPWIIGDAEKTRYISELLKQRGIFAVAIQPPSVPPRKSRIRFCVSAQHSDDDVSHLIQAVSEMSDY